MTIDDFNGDFEFRNEAVRDNNEAVAIIGMSCLFPGSPDVDAYWRNILNKVDSITDPPEEAWDPAVYYDSEFSDTDKVYCQRGGYLGDLVSFDPLKHGVPPLSVGGEPDQWLALELAHAAMADAGCTDLPQEIRHRTAVVLGKGTYLNGGNATAIQRSLIVGQTLEVLKQLHPEMPDGDFEKLREEMKRVLPAMGPEMVAGLIPNIIVGRIANRLDLMGPTYTVDAACASSLVALQLGVRDLLSGECDLALVGGSQVWMPVPALNVFCRLGALSPEQRIKPFDKDADGTLLGEGIGMIVLKRLSDAERDGDRIYSVVRGIGVASDGRGVSVMAPRVEGEILALRRAYGEAGISPSTVGLIEAHGTATPVGDVVEVQALTEVFGKRNGHLPSCALGTVKSMISHTIPAAGIAGLIKTSLALYHKVLPPTLNVTEPNPKLNWEELPFYINTEVRPWIHGGPEPRRAGINAFGFGGINSHAILEEYVDPESRVSSSASALDFSDGAPPIPLSHLPAWDSEVCILEAESPAELRKNVHELIQRLDRLPVESNGARDDLEAISLADVAATLNSEAGQIPDTLRLAVIATSISDLRDKLSRATERLADPECVQIKDVSGIYYAAEPLGRDGKVAFLFPGEGAQYTNMLSDLCIHFPEVRETFDRVDRVFVDDAGRDEQPSDTIFPRPSFSAEDRQAAQNRLMQMDSAIEAVLTANVAVLSLLRRLGLEPDASVGHSTGEYSAAFASGVLDLDTEEQLGSFSRALNGYYRDAALQGNVPRAVLLAIGAGQETAQAIADEAGGDIFVALDNCPHQSVLIGSAEAAARAREIIEQQALIYEELTYDRAVHTPLFEPFTGPLREIFDDVAVRPARTPLYSCTTVAPYPADPDAIRDLFIEHWTAPVKFRPTIEKLYEEGFRIFVEVGPRGNLTAFVQDILRGRESVAVPANVQRRSSITQLNHLVGILMVQGVDLNLDFLHARRSSRVFDWEDLERIGPNSKPSTRIQLATGWPMLQLSQRVVEEVSSSFETQSPEDRQTRQSASSLGNEASTGEHQEIGGPENEESASPEPLPAPDDATPAFAESEPERYETKESGRLSEMQTAGTIPGHEVSGIVHTHLDMMDQFLTAHSDVLEAYLQYTHLPPSSHNTATQSQHDTVPFAALSDGLSGPDTGTTPNGQPLGTDEINHSNGSRVTDHSTPSSRTSRPAGAMFGEAGAARFPLLGDVHLAPQGRELVARRVFDLKTDLYLLDHTLGRDISQVDPDLPALPIMPLAMSLEILAEAAACLVPHKSVVGLRDVRAHRWIIWDQESQELEVVAREIASGDQMKVHVQLRNLTEDRRVEMPLTSPVIEADVLLDSEYPVPPAPIAAKPSEAQGSRWTASALYGDGGMFHGPKWRGVTSIKETGRDGSIADLRILPFDGFLRDDDSSSPEFVLDPVALDAAGQVIGFWTAEHLETANVIFPFRLQALDIFGRNRASGESVTCAAETRLIGDQLVDSDIDLVTAEGHLWMRLTGWLDKRFELPPSFQSALVTSGLGTMSTEWIEINTCFHQSERIQCRIVAPEFTSDQSFWKLVWAHRVLGRNERSRFTALALPEKRQIEWLGARTAAKEAIQHLLRQEHGIELSLADIEIETDDQGKPIVAGSWLGSSSVIPLVSLSHSNGTAVALISLTDSSMMGGSVKPGVGIDIEHLRDLPDGFLETAFTQSEIAQLTRLPTELTDEWALRCWCAKEALGKALGSGLTHGPHSVLVTGIDREEERIFTQLGERLAEAHPELPATNIAVCTARRENLIAAVTRIGPSRSQS